MFFWSATLFGLGVLAFLDSIYNMGEIFRQVNSVFFMLISLALLIRTSTKVRSQRTEKYEERIFNLEKKVDELRNHKEKMEVY